eukprot:scaffold912_cov108-Isochrysis_galbana.AAC.9
MHMRAAPPRAFAFLFSYSHRPAIGLGQDGFSGTPLLLPVGIRFIPKTSRWQPHALPSPLPVPDVPHSPRAPCAMCEDDCERRWRTNGASRPQRPCTDEQRLRRQKCPAPWRRPPTFPSPTPRGSVPGSLWWPNLVPQRLRPCRPGGPHISANT